MKLSQAIDFTLKHREAWQEKEGRDRAPMFCNIRKVLRILGPDKDVFSLKRSDIRDMQAQLMEEGLSGPTVNRVTSVITAVMNELEEHDYDVPELRFKRKKENPGRPGFYTWEEVQFMLIGAQVVNDYMLLHDSVLIAYLTGCREGEMFKLEARDCDFQERKITFRDTKTGGDHIIHMHEDLVEPLQRRIDYATCERLFPWNSRDTLLRALYKLKDSVNVPTDDGRCWHTFRHTTATVLLEKGVPVRTVMGVLNHTSIHTTLRYGKFTERSVAEAIKTL